MIFEIIILKLLLIIFKNLHTSKQVLYNCFMKSLKNLTALFILSKSFSIDFLAAAFGF